MPFHNRLQLLRQISARQWSTGLCQCHKIETFLQMFGLDLRTTNSSQGFHFYLKIFHDYNVVNLYSCPSIMITHFSSIAALSNLADQDQACQFTSFDQYFLCFNDILKTLFCFEEFCTLTIVFNVLSGAFTLFWYFTAFFALVNGLNFCTSTLFDIHCLVAFLPFSSFTNKKAQRALCFHFSKCQS